MSAAGAFHRHHVAVHRYLRHATADAPLAEDLCQETFLRVTRSPCPFNDLSHERAWLFRTARNLLLNHRRDSGRRPHLVRETAAVQEPAREIAVEARLDLLEALRSLPELDHDVFLMRELGGLGYAEIATACDVSPAAVRSRIHRARCALRTFLAPSGSPNERPLKVTR